MKTAYYRKYENNWYHYNNKNNQKKRLQVLKTVTETQSRFFPELHRRAEDTRDIRKTGMNWIHPSRDRVQWRAVVRTVMNLWVHKKREVIK
jgi:hypothetical protein